MIHRGGGRRKEREDSCIWTFTASPLYYMSSNFPKKRSLGKSCRYLSYTPQSHPLSLISSFHCLKLNFLEEEKDILSFKIHAYEPVTPFATKFQYPKSAQNPWTVCITWDKYFNVLNNSIIYLQDLSQEWHKHHNTHKLNEEQQRCHKRPNRP